MSLFICIWTSYLWQSRHTAHIHAGQFSTASDFVSLVLAPAALAEAPPGLLGEGLYDARCLLTQASSSSSIDGS